ncbi:MAG: hypothetical protein D6711_06190 [Chloroflexi bacterium]|nr:MAG: hypothetical protein D6711_06190 [Chloroflexota bacterium]
MREEFLIDPEPAGLRLAVVAAFFIGFIGGFAVLSTVFSLGACSLIGIFGGLGVATVLTLVTENVLRRVWKSNRRLVVENDRLAFEFGGKPMRAIKPGGQVNVLAWRFATKRRTRVPKGWYMVAINFEQDDVYLPVFTLMSPEAFDALPFKDIFFELTGTRRDLEKEQDLRLAGQKRRILMAETARGIDGVEMLNEDFMRFVLYMRETFSTWMP